LTKARLASRSPVEIISGTASASLPVVDKAARSSAIFVQKPQVGERARETISRLSDFLRYSLSNRTSATVSVADEFQIVRDYLAIEQVRFEEKLDAEVTLDGTAADERLPVFLVHTLVENAVKHGAPLNGRLGIRIRGHVREGVLRLEVANTGVLEPNTRAEECVGLRNAYARMDAIFPGKYSLNLFQDGDWVRAVVTIELAGGLDVGRA
jgi:LytS/YehU family sensor histidine kinase